MVAVDDAVLEPHLGVPDEDPTAVLGETVGDHDVLQPSGLADPQEDAEDLRGPLAVENRRGATLAIHGATNLEARSVHDDRLVQQVGPGRDLDHVAGGRDGGGRGGVGEVACPVEADGDGVGGGGGGQQARRESEDGAMSTGHEASPLSEVSWFAIWKVAAGSPDSTRSPTTSSGLCRSPSTKSGMSPHEGTTSGKPTGNTHDGGCAPGHSGKITGSARPAIRLLYPFPGTCRDERDTDGSEQDAGHRIPARIVAWTRP